MSSILQELEAQIANVSTSVEKTNIGIVRETGDGVAKVEGLSDAQLNEMIEFPGGLTGLALNLEEDNVGVVLMGDSGEIKEGAKERLQYYEGVIISIKNSGLSKTITVRRVLQNIGVERVFLINSPKIKAIEIKRSSKVRRAKLYYLRERSGKAARIKERR